MLIVQLIFLNLFIAVILQGFEQSDNLESGMLTGADLENFREAWAKFDPKASEIIKITQLWDLLSILEPPIG